MDEEGTGATGTEGKGEAQTQHRKRERSRDRDGTTKRRVGGSARRGDAGGSGNDDGHDDDVGPGWGAGTSYSRHNTEGVDCRTGEGDGHGDGTKKRDAEPDEEAAGGGGGRGRKRKRRKQKKKEKKKGRMERPNRPSRDEEKGGDGADGGGSFGGTTKLTNVGAGCTAAVPWKSGSNGNGKRAAAICCFTEAGTGQAWDKDGMTPHAAVVENGRDRWKTPDANPR